MNTTNKPKNQETQPAHDLGQISEKQDEQICTACKRLHSTGKNGMCMECAEQAEQEAYEAENAIGAMESAISGLDDAGQAIEEASE